MPSTLVLNADLDVCPALGTWIINNTQLLSGFSLLIAEDVLQELAKRNALQGLSIVQGSGDSPRRRHCDGGHDPQRGDQWSHPLPLST